MKRMNATMKSKSRRPLWATLLVLAVCLASLTPYPGYAEQPPPPCHPNPNAAADMATVASRGDVAFLPTPLKNRLVQFAGRPHTFFPQQAEAEAPNPRPLFQYHLLDTHGLQPH